MPDTLATGTDVAGTPAVATPPAGDTSGTGTPPAGAPAASAPPAGAPAAAAPGADGKPPAAPKPGEEAAVVYNFKVPDGIQLDKSSTEEFTAIAKELKLPADAAQKVVDLAVKREQARVTEHVKTITGWAESVKTGKDAEGKDLPEHLRVPGGEKLAETLSVCKKALDLGPPELKELLNTSGLGNHPAMVRWAYAVGKAMSEDRMVQGNAGAAASTTMEQRLYGNSTGAKA